MARQKVSFGARKTVSRPTTVRFKTKTGKTVSFKAFKTAEKKVHVRFRAKKK